MYTSKIPNTQYYLIKHISYLSDPEPSFTNFVDGNEDINVVKKKHIMNHRQK